MSRSRKQAGGFITITANRPGVRKKLKKIYNKRWRKFNKRGVLYYKHKEIVNLWRTPEDGKFIAIWGRKMSK